MNSKLQDDNLSKTTYMGLRFDKTFYRNYIVGTWSTSKNKLYTHPNNDLNMPAIEYRIVELIDATLTLETTLTEKDYLWNFAYIDENEQITVVEKYIRH